MGGVVKINDPLAWVAAGWMFDNVLKKMADDFPAKDDALRDLLMNSRTDKSVGYCDLRKLDKADFIKVIQTAAAVYLKTVTDGPKAFADPKFYPGYIKHFEKLLEMLKSDPRANGRVGSTR